MAENNFNDARTTLRADNMFKVSSAEPTPSIPAGTDPNMKLTTADEIEQTRRHQDKRNTYMMRLVFILSIVCAGFYIISLLTPTS